MARMHGFMIGIVFLLVLACSGLINAAPYEEPVRAGSAGALTGIVRALIWDREGPYTAQAMNLSKDIRVTQRITLAAKDMAVPEVCLKRDDCRKAVTMVIPKDMAGVECVKTEDVMGAPHCVEAVLSQNSTFRIRAKLLDTHPWKYNFIPVVEFTEASTHACKPGELQCLRDKTCWKNFNGYCRYCLARPVERCACQNEKGPLSDGTSCTFFISGDMVCVGKCRDGLCESTDGRCR